MDIVSVYSQWCGYCVSILSMVWILCQYIVNGVDIVLVYSQWCGYCVSILSMVWILC